MAHISVLLKQTIDLLNIKNGDTIIDCTLGNGGHSKEICNRAQDLTLIGIDADQSAIDEAEKNLSNCKATKIFIQSYYEEIKNIVTKNHIQKVTKILIDLGLRTDQLEQADRGFSFKNEGPLKMTFSLNGEGNQVTAYDVINDWQEENLADIIYGFGEEKFSRRIARAIVTEREKKVIETTAELAQIISDAVPFWYRKGKIHPATKTFQAIRMTVNRELEQIDTVIKDGYEILEKGGRIAVITFHSIEDRLVKRIFNKLVETKNASLVNKKVIIPSREETFLNPKSRSAKLRVIQKN